MNITEPFVLKNDVLLIPCTDLSDDLRERIEFDEGDFTLSRRHGRALVQVIDGETAALLGRFREPRTIVQAVVENSRELGRDPRVSLRELMPHLGKFLHNRVLVPVGSDDEKELHPQYESGAKIGRWEIVRCINFIEDSEVYQLRDGDDVAALKIARFTNSAIRTIFENEIAILGHLDGSGITPRIIESGFHEERPYLIMEWIRGVNAGIAAAQRRHDRPGLIEVCASIAAAYAELHGRGVLHADVHPHNVIVNGGRVTLLDFGYSRFADRPWSVGRGGMYYFFEPEYLAAREEGNAMHSSAAGEQYSLAAMLYFLIADNDYLDFRYDREEMVRQVLTEPPLPFAKRGIPPWPEAEEILFRALEKDPARRYGSMAEMAAALAAARDAAVQESLSAALSSQAHEFLESTLRSFARGGEMFTTRYEKPPTASITFGAAGAAVGLLRIAEARGDAALLALADVWKSRALTLIGTEHAYYEEPELTRAMLGEATPYHTESGIHAAVSLLAAARDDTYSKQRAIAAFLRSSTRTSPKSDLTLGICGSLLASAMLLPISGDIPEAAALRSFGTRTMNAIWDELDACAPIAAMRAGTFTGMAHGWAGYLYATMRWCAVSGDALPPRLVERLHQLAAMRIVKDRGVYWVKQVGGALHDAVPGWCNGSAGHVFLFTLAHRLLGDEQWLRLTELAAWNCWDEPRGPTSLCCGTSGRAYALLNFYKHTGAIEWLSRAKQLANHAAEQAVVTSGRKSSLWRGELGVAVLIADLASPENARMPFFE